MPTITTTDHEAEQRRIAEVMRSMSSEDLVWLISGGAGKTPARYVVAGRAEILARLRGERDL